MDTLLSGRSQVPYGNCRYDNERRGALVAFHPRPQIASDLGPQLHPQLQPAPKSQPIPEWERNFGLWPQTQIAAGLNPLRFENRKPNPPLCTGDLNSSNRKPAGRNRRIRAVRRPQIAESPATRPLGEALATFERNLIIHFQQTSKTAALYVRPLLGGIKRALEIYGRVDAVTEESAEMAHPGTKLCEGSLVTFTPH